VVLSETDCNEILIEIESYIDREVDGARYEEIEVHLKRCPPCLERADFKAKLKEIISAKCCSEAVPEELADRIRSLVSSQGEA